MLKRLQERVNRGTEGAEEAKVDEDADPPHSEESEKLAGKQLDIEEMTRKISERMGVADPPCGEHC